MPLKPKIKKSQTKTTFDRCLNTLKTMDDETDETYT